MPLTPFPTEFAPEAVQVVWDAYRKRAVDPYQASLAGWNVLGYGLGQLVPQGGTFEASAAPRAGLEAYDEATPAPDDAAVDAAFERALAFAAAPEQQGCPAHKMRQQYPLGPQNAPHAALASVPWDLIAEVAWIVLERLRRR